MASPSPLDRCWIVKDSPDALPIMTDLCRAVEAHWPYAKLAASSMLGDEGCAAEIMDSAIKRTVEHFAEQDSKKSDDIAQILARFCTQEVRKRRKCYTQIVFIDFAFSSDAWCYHPSAGADAIVDTEHLLRNAPPEVRKALMMRYGCADSWREVAAVTGTSAEAIRKKCNRWLDQIRRKLGIPTS